MPELTFEDRNRIEKERALHKAVRLDDTSPSREKNLFWGYIRGFKYRRIERKYYIQKVRTSAGIVEVHHHRPSVYTLARLMIKYCPEKLPSYELGLRPDGDPPGSYTIKNQFLKEAESLLTAWVDNPEGAIPPPKRVK